MMRKNVPWICTRAFITASPPASPASVQVQVQNATAIHTAGMRTGGYEGRCCRYLACASLWQHPRGGAG